MANDEHVEIAKRGAEAIAKWRMEHPEMRLDLQDADLKEVNLRGRIFSQRSSLARIRVGRISVPRGSRGLIWLQPT
jgi:hypothetical protein